MNENENNENIVNGENSVPNTSPTQENMASSASSHSSINHSTENATYMVQNVANNQHHKQEQKNTQNTYRPVGEWKAPKEKSHVGRSFGIPFLSGLLGTTVALSICFGVPEIKNLIIGENYTSSTSTSQSQVSNPVSNAVSLANYSETGIAVADKVRPSIVGIRVEFSVDSIFYPSTQTSTAEGSGIIMTEDGYILTNNHIVSSSSSSSFYEVSKANKVTVYLYGDDTGYEAEIVGMDDQTDLAVIKIDKTGLTAAELGDSDSVLVGEYAMAIGNPLGLQNSVSAGIISATNRDITTTDGKSYTLIQTDAAINAGNSGGALVNADGKVIGINTLKLTGDNVEGMGFAIPINSAKDIYEQLVEYKKVKRPTIGITGIDLDEETAKANHLVVGVYVRSVEDFSAAQKADLRPGDVIIEADGQKITTMDELNEIKNSHKIGDTMTLKVNRNGTEKTITLTLQEQADNQ